MADTERECEECEGTGFTIDATPGEANGSMCLYCGGAGLVAAVPEGGGGE